MLSEIVVIGIVMAATELYKYSAGKTGADPELTKRLIPLIVLGGGGIMQVANTAVFDAASDPDLLSALGRGIELGAIAGGVYGLGKAGLGKS